MPNVLKYDNINWPSALSVGEERLATNGEYTGQHKGTPMQDALEKADNAPYLRARNTIRYGTITPDAADDNFPDILIDVSYTATGEVTDISLENAIYDSVNELFKDVPSKTESFTFKDGDTLKTATNSDGKWSFA